MLSNYFIHIAILIGIYLVLAMSLNLSVGYTGLINLGHIAFYGVGAYTSALAVLHGVPFIFALPLAGIMAGCCGGILALSTRKLSGDYLAVATLGFSFVTYSVFLNWSSLTRGPLGIPGIPRPRIFGWHIVSAGDYLIFVVLVVLVALGFFFLLTRSRYGKLLQAVRDDAVGAAALGKNIVRLKWQSLVIAAFWAGVAGSIYAHYISFIDPATFYLEEIIVIFTIVIMGGLASFKGSIIATIIIIVLPELLRFVALPSSLIGPVRQILYASLLILILLIRPRGLFGKVDLQ